MHELNVAYASGSGSLKIDRRRRPLRAPSEAAALRVLENVNLLSEDERSLIRRLSLFRDSIQAGRPFWRAGQPIGAKLVLSGWAARQRTLPDGRRQIFGFVIPGDVIGVVVTPSPLEEVSTVALTRVEAVDALMLREILAMQDERHSRLNAALNHLRRQEDACLLDHIMRLGRQSALERTAHFLLEMHDRTWAAGLAEGDRFPLPLTQEVLADALGLSIVHLNRTLQQMKRDGLIELRSSWATLYDRPYLEKLADYGPHDD
jgi:CRP-like cAMP-binding protein